MELKNCINNNFIYFHGSSFSGNNLRMFFYSLFLKVFFTSLVWINMLQRNTMSVNNSARLLVFWLERQVMETNNAPFSIIINFNGLTEEQIVNNFFKMFLFKFRILILWSICRVAWLFTIQNVFKKFSYLIILKLINPKKLVLKIIWICYSDQIFFH